MSFITFWLPPRGLRGESLFKDHIFPSNGFTSKMPFVSGLPQFHCDRTRVEGSYSGLVGLLELVLGISACLLNSQPFSLQTHPLHPLCCPSFCILVLAIAAGFLFSSFCPAVLYSGLLLQAYFLFTSSSASVLNLVIIFTRSLVNLCTGGVCLRMEADPARLAVGRG